MKDIGLKVKCGSIKKQDVQLQRENDFIDFSAGRHQNAAFLRRKIVSIFFCLKAFCYLYIVETSLHGQTMSGTFFPRDFFPLLFPFPALPSDEIVHSDTEMVQVP